MKKRPSNIRRAILCFQYVERTKSELIIASKLLWEIDEMTANELVGAEKLMESFLEALLGEIRIAFNALKLQNFKRAGEKVSEAMSHLQQRGYPMAGRALSEAISLVTTSGQSAIQTLIEEKLL